MAIHVQIPPFKFTKQQKKALSDYLTGKAELRKTAETLGVTPTKLYRMCATLIRHASTTGRINIEEVIKHY